MRQLTSVLFCFAIWFILCTPMNVYSQTDGNRAGKKKTGKQSGFDPDAFFDLLAGGKEYLEIEKTGFLARRLYDYAKHKGITNGKLTRQQLREYFEEYRKKNNNLTESKSPREFTKEESEAYVKRKIDGFFYSRDRNRDGFLDRKEMSFRLLDQLPRFDKNRDGKINYKETTEYIRFCYFGAPISHLWLDIEKTFKRLAKGKPHIAIAKVDPLLRWQLTHFAQTHDITNGKLTKAQFQTFVGELRWLWYPSLGPPPTPHTKFSAKLKRWTEDYFSSRDRNKDQQLDFEEMSDTMKKRYKTFDRDGDGRINYAEAREYMRTRIATSPRFGFLNNSK